MARKHQYIEKIKVSYDALVGFAIDAWIEYSFKKHPVIKHNTDYIEWKCFHCSKPIKVKYNISRIRYLYCLNCRPRFIRTPNAIQVRYLSKFREKVNEIILKNTGL